MEKDTNVGDIIENNGDGSQDAINELSHGFTTDETSQNLNINDAATSKDLFLSFPAGIEKIQSWVENLSKSLKDISYDFMVDGLKEYNTNKSYKKESESFRTLISWLFYKNTFFVPTIYMLLMSFFFLSVWVYTYIFILISAVSIGAKYMLKQDLKDAEKNDAVKVKLLYHPFFAALLIAQVLLCFGVCLWFLIINGILFVINYAKEKEWIPQCLNALKRLKSN